MSISFNFNETAFSNLQIEKKPSTYLQGNTINIVTLKECKAIDLDTKNGKLKVLEFTFANKDGLVYSDRVFEPRSKERVANQSGYPSPSEYDYFMTKIKMYARVMAPKLFETMNSGKLPVVSSWDQLTVLLAKQFNNDLLGKKEFKLKLLKNRDNFATVPRYFLSINKDGEMYISSRFIGELTDDVDFTKSESKTIEEKAKYTPTAMPNVAPTKDDVLDTVTGDIIAPSSEPQVPFGGGASDSWESLL